MPGTRITDGKMGGHSSSLVKSATNWASILSTLGIWAIVGMLIFICAGGTVQVHSLRMEMEKVNQKIAHPDIFSKLPGNQMELTTKQFLSIVENTHRISARMHFLLDKVEPAQTVAFVNDAKTILERVSNLLERNTTDALLGMVEQINRIPMRSLVDALVKFDVRKFNELAESTKLIEEKLNRLHEIKIQI